jgi:Holliday junction resolvasome RuvABC ATP-dependent DNA helicase subunit
MMEQTQRLSVSPRQIEAEASARLKQFKEYAVLHPQLAQVDLQLTRAIEEPAGFAYVLLYGPSGVGKTTVLRQIERRYREAAVSSAPSLVASLARAGHPPSIPLLVMETRPPDGLAFNRAD